MRDLEYVLMRTNCPSCAGRYGSSGLAEQNRITGCCTLADLEDETWAPAYELVRRPSRPRVGISL